MHRPSVLLRTAVLTLRVKTAGDYWIKLRRDRDLVFVDQRGTGESNPLNCGAAGNRDEMRAFFTEATNFELSATALTGKREQPIEGALLDAKGDAVTAVAAHKVGTDSWFEAVATANKANGDHMAEEEREGLTDFRRHASLETRHKLAIAFAAFETSHVEGGEPVEFPPRAPFRDGRPDDRLAAAGDVEYAVGPGGRQGGEGGEDPGGFHRREP